MLIAIPRLLTSFTLYSILSPVITSVAALDADFDADSDADSDLLT